MTNDRPASLERLLTALESAHYFGDDVSLALNLEQTADRATQKLVDGFEWNAGPVTLRHRIILGGLMPAIVESWYPSSNDSYGVFLEDDVEVSPLFYGWLKMTILYYRYSSEEMRARSSRLFGVSLYQQKMIELRPEGRRPFDAHEMFSQMSLESNLPYLSQIPCSWGAAYFPEIWKEFHSFLSLRLSEISLPISETIVPEIRSNSWPRSWKKYIIELIYMRGYVMLYPNYPNFASLSTNHLEKGTHIKQTELDIKKKSQFIVPLMNRSESLLDLPQGKLPPWDNLPLIDLWGSIATDEEVVERGWQTTAQLDSCPPFRLDVPPTFNARELLCKKVYDRTNRLIDAQPLPSKAREAQRIEEELAAAEEALRLERERQRPVIVGHPDSQAEEENEADHYHEEEHNPTEGGIFGGQPAQDLADVLHGDEEGSLHGHDHPHRVEIVDDDEPDFVGTVAQVPEGKETYEIDTEVDSWEGSEENDNQRFRVAKERAFEEGDNDLERRSVDEEGARFEKRTLKQPRKGR